ncbi:MAG: 3-phosphoglycerate dehydrogenase, partial [Betaproteobacteria bacterium]|nr:3-phosphoglycerate dehydrogenase [Betaproteobacteria bacterium]
MKIVITEFMDASAVDSLRDRYTVVYDPALVDHRSELLDLLKDAPALIVRNRSRVDAELLAAAPQLRVVGRLGVGLDNINLPACQARGIEVIPATGANAQAVAEYVLATVMTLLRGLHLSSAETATGKWPRQRLSEGHETAGRTLGLVGFGGIGQLTARLALALGMRVVAYDPLLPADAPAWAE